MNNEGYRSINVQLMITKDGELESVKALEGKGYEIIDEGTLSDLSEICAEGPAVIQSTSVLLISQENPTCLRWKIRRTSNGYSRICVKWSDG